MKILILTKRERHVAKLVMQGMSNKQVARALGICEGTVKVHLHSAYTKLGAANRVQLFNIIKQERVGA